MAINGLAGAIGTPASAPVESVATPTSQGSAHDAANPVGLSGSEKQIAIGTGIGVFLGGIAAMFGFHWINKLAEKGRKE